ncbi:MAG TPA: DUF58 domain-containing protein [Kofleriaceae bacterium]|nr:DUF58 domain-containing protein [Kofleriaceae bacterium]
MRPTLRFVLLLVATLPLAVVPAIMGAGAFPAWVAVIGAVTLLLLLDAALGAPRRRVSVSTEAPPQIFIGDTGELVMTVKVKSTRTPEVELVPEIEGEVTRPAPAVFRLRPDGGQSTAVVRFPFVPTRRGTPRVTAVHLRWAGPLGLVERRWRRPLDVPVAVVPNLGAVRAMALRMLSNKEMMSGLKVERYVGDGSEFEMLREYVPGLDHRAMDWKASARHLKLLCQQFRAERNHQVIIAIDNGQLMSEPLAGIPRLDHAVNAGLLLSWMCLKTGDRVGLLGFDEKVRTWSEPAGGMHAFPRLTRLTADLAYRRTESNYTLALAELAQRVKRRSLVVLFTDFLDSITAELMIENVRRLARHHLVLFVAVGDPAVDGWVRRGPRSLSDLHEAVVAGGFARERRLVLERLRRAGAMVIDTTPEHFSMALLNRYLDIKRRELLR